MGTFRTCSSAHSSILEQYFTLSNKLPFIEIYPAYPDPAASVRGILRMGPHIPEAVSFSVMEEEGGIYSLSFFYILFLPRSARILRAHEYAFILTIVIILHERSDHIEGIIILPVPDSRGVDAFRSDYIYSGLNARLVSQS